MVGIFEKVIWGLSALLVVAVVACFFLIGAPTATPYILAQSQQVSRKQLVETLTPEQVQELDKATQPPASADGKSGGGSPSRRRSPARSEIYKVNRPLFDLVSNENMAIRESRKAKSEVIVDKKTGAKALRIYDFSPTFIGKKVGFEENDVLQAIDGQEIDWDSVLEARELFQTCREKFEKGLPISFSIVRRGVNMNIVVAPGWLKK